MKCFDLGCTMACIVKNTNGHYMVTVKWHDTEPVTTMHRTELEALREILSYTEVEEWGA